MTSGLVEAMNMPIPICFAGWGELYGDIAETMLDFNKTNAMDFAKIKMS